MRKRQNGNNPVRYRIPLVRRWKLSYWTVLQLFTLAQKRFQQKNITKWNLKFESFNIWFEFINFRVLIKILSIVFERIGQSARWSSRCTPLQSRWSKSGPWAIFQSPLYRRWNLDHTGWNTIVFSPRKRFLTRWKTMWSKFVIL